MRTILWTGSRTWQDESAIRLVIEGFPRPFRSIVGDAKGFDALTWKLLREFDMPRLKFKAKWSLYRNGAGPTRNTLMLAWLSVIDPKGFVVAGWDGESTGTKNCIDQAKGMGIAVWKIA